jgi:hypothetical protein
VPRPAPYVVVTVNGTAVERVLVTIAVYVTTVPLVTLLGETVKTTRFSAVPPPQLAGLFVVSYVQMHVSRQSGMKSRSLSRSPFGRSAASTPGHAPVSAPAHGMASAASTMTSASDASEERSLIRTAHHEITA